MPYKKNRNDPPKVVAGKPGHKGKSFEPTFTDAEREEVLLEVARLDRRGYSQYRIAKLIGVSQPMVHQYLQKIKKRYEEETLAERAAKVNEVYHTYRDIMAEAWDGYEKSKEDRKQRKREDSVFGETSGYKESETVEGRLADVGYLRVVQECVSGIRDLYGLDAPKKVETDNRHTVAPIDWDSLYGREREYVDRAEERLRLEARELAGEPRVTIEDADGKVLGEGKATRREK